MNNKSLRYLFILTLTTLVSTGCGLLDDIKSQIEDGIANAIPKAQQIVEATGDTLVQGTKTAIASAVGDVMKTTSALGGNIPGEVTPAKGLFEDDSSAASTAPVALAPGSKWSAWQGPGTGPDNNGGWYYREYSNTRNVWDQASMQNTEVTDIFRYWLRTDPEGDVSQGLGTLSAKKIYYAWTAESGDWAGSVWLMNFTFKNPVKLPDGTVIPGSVEGSYTWNIPATAKFYAGTRSKGDFRYAGVDPEGFMDGEAFKKAFNDAAINDTFEIAADGESASNYQGVFYNRENTKTAEWFGGGKGNMAFTLKLTKLTADTGRAEATMDGSNIWYWGKGQKSSSLDYTTLPPFAEGVTPAGDDWGVPEHFGNDNFAPGDNQPLNPRDGLMAWTDSKWNATFSGEGNINDSDNKNQDSNDNNGTFYNKFEYNTYSWDGSKDSNSGVYCSSPDVAPDCPADNGNDQNRP